MYQPQQAAQPTVEQVVFEILIKTAQEMARTSRLYSYSLNVFAQTQFQNSRMINMVETTLKLYQMRSRTQSSLTPEQLLMGICRQVITVMTANLISQDQMFLNQLTVLERAQVTADRAYTEAIDAEITAYEQLASSPEFQSSLVNHSALGPRTSSRYAGRKNTMVAPVTRTVAEQPVEVEPVKTYRGRTVRSSAPVVTEPAKETKMPSTAAFTKAIPHDPVSTVVTVTGNVIDKDQKMHHAHERFIRSQVAQLSTAKPHDDAMKILAAGISFDPMKLVVPEDLANAGVEAQTEYQNQVNEVMQKIIHSTEPLFAMGAAHAELQFLTQMQELNIDVRQVPHSFDYRDIEIHYVQGSDEAKTNSSVFSKTEYSGIVDLFSLKDFIDAMVASGDLIDLDMASVANDLATAAVNEYLFFYGGISVEIEDYAADLQELITYLESRYNDTYTGFLVHQKAIVQRVTDSLFKGMDPEEAKKLNSWASIKSPTLRNRIYGVSCWRAAMWLPVDAYELGLSIARSEDTTLSAKWAFISDATYPVFYNAAMRLMEELPSDAFAYRSISIYTRDGFEYRIRYTTRVSETGQPQLAVTLLNKE